MKLLHCTKQLDFLKKTIQEGAMLREHPVRSRLESDASKQGDVYTEILSTNIPMIQNKLRSIGIDYNSLSDSKIRSLISGVGGSVRAIIPMFCLTGRSKGDDIASHGGDFGTYALVFTRRWLISAGVRKVTYIGDNTKTSRAFVAKIAKKMVSGLHKDTHTNEPVYDNNDIKWLLYQLRYIQPIKYAHQLEWRIAGDPGIMGSTSEMGKNIPISIGDIEHIFVSNDVDIDEIKDICSDLAKTTPSTNIPSVGLFPERFPY